MPNVIDRVATQAAGTIGAIRASVKGLRGIFLRLPEEHREVLALVTRARSAGEPSDRLALWSDLKHELLAHEYAEVQVVYPQLSRYPELGDFIEQHDALAQEVNAAVAAVDALDADSSEFQTRLVYLDNVLRRHAELEDDHFFPRAQAVIGSERAEELEGLYTNARRSILHDLKFPSGDDPSDGR